MGSGDAPLERVRRLLCDWGLKPRDRGGALLLAGPKGDTEVRVIEPADSSTDKRPIEAVVQVRARLAEGPLGGDPRACDEANRQAALGALIRMDGGPCLASRLTTFVGEGDAWRLHVPLLAYAAAYASEGGPVTNAIVAGTWPDHGLPTNSGFVARKLAPLSSRFGFRVLCSSGVPEFTIDLPLRGGEGVGQSVSRFSARVTFSSCSPHPVLGPGLRVVLELPHRVEAPDGFHRLLGDMNAWEAAPANSVPHYGAWTAGESRSLAYRCFVPQAIWMGGLIENLLVWMVTRARLADGFLLARGLAAG